MSDRSRQHPVAAITNVIEIVRNNFITILIIVFVGSGTDEQSLVNLYWLLGTIAVLLIWGVLTWLRFTYQVVDGEFRVQKGILVRKKLYLTADRIQVIDISAGIVQRMFGLVSVEVKTAGSSSKQARLSAITRGEAELLQKLLRKPADVEAHEEVAEEVAYQLDLKNLLITASTSGSFGIALSIVGTVYTQIDQVVSEERMIHFIQNELPAFYSGNMVFYSIILIILVSWLLTFFGTLIKYAGFNVVLRNEEMVISKGLFERKQLTIPFNRIQAIQIKEELLRQPLGYANVVLESAGYDEEGGKATTLCPLIKKRELSSFLSKVIPEFDVQVGSVTVPGVSLRRYIFRMMIVASMVVIPIWAFIPYGIYSLFFMPIAVLLGYGQYLAAAVGSGENTLIMRYRKLSKVTAIIKRYRVQAVELKSTPFQRRLNLVTLTIQVASGQQGRSFSIWDLSKPLGIYYWDWVSPERSFTDERIVEQPLLTLPAIS
ncbi:MAG: PH domain-containing protein [Balneolaceae bacterium]|nr:PH domain-containing protein [Balneolaceae bacterium]